MLGEGFASQKVEVRPGLTTSALNTKRVPFAGASRLVLNSTVRMLASRGISVKAATPHALSRAAIDDAGMNEASALRQRRRIVHRKLGLARRDPDERDAERVLIAGCFAKTDVAAA